MGIIKQINIKNWTFYFFNDMINIKNFNSTLLKTNKNPYKNTSIYYIRYITINNINNYENIYSVNTLHLIIGEANEYIEEKNGNKYLTFASTDKNKEVLENYTKLWNKIKSMIDKIDNKPDEHGKCFIKMKLNSDDNLQIKN